MKNYEISVKEVLERVITIEANSLEEALDKVQEMYDNEEIVLDSGDFQKYEIEEYNDNLANWRKK